MEIEEVGLIFAIISFIFSITVLMCAILGWW